MSLHFKCDVYLNYKTLFIQRKLPSINFRISDPYLKTDCPTCNSHVLRAMAPHSSTLAWRIPWVEEPGRLQSMGREESDMTEQLHFHFSLSCIGEGNGNPLHCSCLENPRYGGAWWAAIYGVTQSRTRLKRLGSSSSSKSQIQLKQLSSSSSSSSTC